MADPLPIAIRAQSQCHLGKNGNGDFGRRACADRKSDGTVNTRQIVVRKSMRLEPCKPTCMRLLRTQRADVEAIRTQGCRQRGVVELGIMGQGDQRAARPQRRLDQSLVRPVMGQRDAGKPRRGGEGRARIDDADTIFRKHRHWRQNLCDVDGADDDHVERRIVDGQEPDAAVDLDRCAAIGAGCTASSDAQCGVVRSRVNQTLFAGLKIDRADDGDFVRARHD